MLARAQMRWRTVRVSFTIVFAGRTIHRNFVKHYCTRERLIHRVSRPLVGAELNDGSGSDSRRDYLDSLGNERYTSLSAFVGVLTHFHADNETQITSRARVRAGNYFDF